MAMALVNVLRFKSMMPSWEAQVQTDHPAKDESEESHAYEQ